LVMSKEHEELRNQTSQSQNGRPSMDDHRPKRTSCCRCAVSCRIFAIVTVSPRPTTAVTTIYPSSCADSSGWKDLEHGLQNSKLWSAAAAAAATANRNHPDVFVIFIFPRSPLKPNRNPIIGLVLLAVSRLHISGHVQLTAHSSLSIAASWQHSTPRPHR
jgi:hypothetical protein